jgi:hypothetical protein
MKRIITSVFVLTFAVCVSGMGAYAQGKGGGHVPGGAGEPRTGKGPEHQESEHHESGAKADPNFESRIESNPQLKAHVQSLLPTNMDLKTAAMGFRNEGQFIAALHASKNLNIPFAQLQAKMTGNHPESLGSAIHDLRPSISKEEAKEDAELAEKQAKQTEKNKPLT